MRTEVYIILPGITGLFPPSWRGLIGPKFSKVMDELYRDSYVSSYSICSHAFEERLIEKFGLISQTPWAWFGLLGEGFKVDSSRWLRLNIQTSNGGIVQDHATIQRVAEDFARDFLYAENSIITSQGGWYLAVGEHRQIRSEPIWSLRGLADIGDFGLYGSDAFFWQERFTDVSHWLFKHPINAERIAKQLPVMELIYPWGFSNYIPSVMPCNYSALFSDNPIFRGMANHLSIAAFPRSFGTADLSQMMINHHKICIIEDRLNLSICDQHFLNWSVELNKVENELIAPCMDAVQRGILDDLFIDDGLGTVLNYKRGLKFKWDKNRYTPIFTDEL